MIFNSNVRNISFLNFICLLFFLSSFFLKIEYNVINLSISLVVYYILNILGVYMTLHRYYSHKSFIFRYKIFEVFSTIIAILAGRGSVIGWVYIHRRHHHYSDQENDPHSPEKIRNNWFSIKHLKDVETDFKIFYVKDLITNFQIFIHKYYMLIIFTFAFILYLINLEVLYFGYILPLLMVHVSQSLFNYFGHNNGYKNFLINDNSRNNILLFPFIMGEAWHNNHHANPKNQSTRVNWYEIDPVYFLIKIISK